MKLLDYFAKFEIMIDYNYDDEEEDFVKSALVGNIDNDEEQFLSIRENAEDKIADYIYYHLLQKDGNEGQKGQLLCKIFDSRDVDEAEGVNMFYKYKKAEDNDDDDKERMYHDLSVNIFDKDFDEAIVDNIVREYIEAHNNGDSLNRLVNDIPLFAIEQVIKAIIYMNLDYEGDVHFDLDGYLDLIIYADNN